MAGKAKPGQKRHAADARVARTISAPMVAGSPTAAPSGPHTASTTTDDADQYFCCASRPNEDKGADPSGNTISPRARRSFR